VQFGARGAGHAVDGPLRREGLVVGRVPVAGGDDEVELVAACQLVDP